MSTAEEIALDLLRFVLRIAPAIGSMFAPDLASREDPLAKRVAEIVPERGASAAVRDELGGGR